MKDKITPSRISVFVIIFLMTCVTANLNWGKDHWKEIILSDGKGYYAYLPAIFIYHDLNLGFFDKIEKQDYYNKFLYYDYRANGNGKVIDKYFCGTALAELPFFLTAHALSPLSGYRPDGYSNLYHILISIAALFYLLAGLVFLNAVLGGYNIREWEKSVVLFAAVFGTNLFYYTVREPSMSHVFSFAFISIFVYCSRKFFATFKTGWIPVLGLVLGVIFLIRPVNALALFFLPFAAGSAATLRKGLTTALGRPLPLIAGILIFLGTASVQFMIYKISTGKFLIDSYGDEGFNFLHPHIADILLSYKKGLFLYTPLYLLSLTGLYSLWKSSRFSVYAWSGFFILITYVFSSWWNWYYGGSFSSRVYVEFIPVFMILLAIALHDTAGKFRKGILVALVVLLTILCQIQTYQYRYYQIHWSEMTKEKYWEVFLRIDKLIK